MNSMITDNIVTGSQENTISTSMNPIDISQIKSSSLSNIITQNPSIKKEYSKVQVPPNRMKPLKENWPTIVKVLVEHMKIQIKMNPKKNVLK
jgi:hypothetical protein